MKNCLKQLKFKGFILGLALAFALGATAVTASVATRITLNNTPVAAPNPATLPDLSPQEMFWLLQTVAAELGITVSYNRQSSTIAIDSGVAELPPPQATNRRVNLFRDHPFISTNNQGSTNPARSSTFSMGNILHNDVVTWSTNGASRWGSTTHNIQGRYTVLSGYVGRRDGTGTRPGYVEFRGDGNSLQRIELPAGTNRVPFSINVVGVHNLQIVLGTTTGGSGTTHLGAVVFVE